MHLIFGFLFVNSRLGLGLVTLAQPKQWKRDMPFGTWKFRSLRTVAGKLGRYRLDLVVVQEVRWDKELL